MKLADLPDELLLQISQYLPLHYIWRLQCISRSFKTLFSSTAAIGIAYDKWNTHEASDYALGATAQRTDPIVERNNGKQRMLAFLTGRPVAFTTIDASTGDLSSLDTQLVGSCLLYGRDSTMHLHNLLSGEHYTWARYWDNWHARWLLTDSMAICAESQDPINLLLTELGKPIRRIAIADNGDLGLTAAHKSCYCITTDIAPTTVTIFDASNDKQYSFTCTPYGEVAITFKTAFLDLNSDTRTVNFYTIDTIKAGRERLTSIQYSFAGEPLGTNTFDRSVNTAECPGYRPMSGDNADRSPLVSCGIRGLKSMFNYTVDGRISARHQALTSQGSVLIDDTGHIHLEVPHDPLLWKNMSFTVSDGLVLCRDQIRTIKKWPFSGSLLAVNDSYLVMYEDGVIVIWSFDEAAYASTQHGGPADLPEPLSNSEHATTHGLLREDRTLSWTQFKAWPS